MARQRQRRRRDQIWNPPSRGSDISAIFVLFAAGPLLLPLIGAQVEVIAFATPLVFCLFAAWRCVLAARRSPRGAFMWFALAGSVMTAAAASVVALASSSSQAAFYVGTAASAMLAVAMLDLARRTLAGVPRARMADALLFPVLATSIAVWFVAVPGYRDGDAILTTAAMLDLVAMCAGAVALVVRPTGANLQVTAPLTLGIAFAMVGDCVVSAQAAGLLETSGLATALLWACAAYSIAVAADFDRGAAPREERGRHKEIA